MSISTSTDQGPTDPDTTNQSPIDQGPAAMGLTDQDTTGQNQASQSPPPPDMDDYLTEEYDYQQPHRGDIRTGVVVESNERGLVVDIGFKREGFVYNEDLSRLDEDTRSSIHVGDTVPVFVLRPTNREGHPILSIHQARLYEDWLKAEQMLESGELYEGEIAGFNRGGLIVRFGKIRGFIPASQVVGLPRRLSADDRRRRLEQMVGQRAGLRIIEVDRRRRRLIFSQRRALRAWQEVQRERVMTELTEGEVRHGIVSDITSFGAFVDLGGADGLIHVSELSWRRVDDPHEVLKTGQEVDVYVLGVDRERKRIALSLKKLEPDPWTRVDEHYQVGQLVEGRITRVLDFGAFVELDLGLEGLLHVSEMIGTPELQPSDIVHPGETMPVKIIRIESQRKRLALSAKQVRKNEWERWVAEQQATRETHEAAAEEEEEVAAPQPEAVISEAAREEEQVAPSEPEVAISEVAEEEKGAVLEAEAAIDEATEENAAPEPEAYAEEVTVYESSPQMEAPLTPGEEATEPTTPPASGVISEVETAY
jgi:small subunit ribosomal protein S1